MHTIKLAHYILAVLSLCRPAGIAAFSCIFFLSAPAFANTVEAKLPAGITAKANFHAGLASLPAVLVLHGFLQTNQSPPMNSLAGNLRRPESHHVLEHQPAQPEYGMRSGAYPYHGRRGGRGGLLGKLALQKRL
jgi:hypothetical protein